MSLISKSNQNKYKADFINPLAAAKKLPWNPIFRTMDALSLASIFPFLFMESKDAKTQRENLEKLEANPALSAAAENLKTPATKSMSNMGKSFNPLPNFELPKTLPPNSLM